MRSIVVMLAAAVAVTACAQERYRNVDAGRSNRYYYDLDSYQCERENTRYIYAFGVLGPDVYEQGKDLCMRVRGWRRA